MSLLRSLSALLLLASIAPAQSSSLCVAVSDNAVYDNGISMGGPLLLAIQLQTTAPLNATRLEVWTGELTGASSVGIWTHDPATNLPGVNLGTGQWNMGQVNGWQGARLPAAVAVPAGTYWFVWGNPGGGQASVEIGGTPNAPAPGAQLYRASFDGGQSWNGGAAGFRSHLWKLRVRCGGSPGSYEVFGSGCRGSGRNTPILGFSDAPTLGRTMEVNLSGAPTSTAAYLAIGDSSQTWLGLPLPLDLSPFGAAPCTLLCSAVTFLGVQTTNGTAGVGLSVPIDPALLGAPFFNQWWVASPTATALGFVFSNGGRGVVGN
jgi:hypothetical protein